MFQRRIAVAVLKKLQLTTGLAALVDARTTIKAARPGLSGDDAVLTDELLSRIEEAGINASAPPQQRLIDGWLVRFCPGKAKRARCVNAISAGRLLIEEKLALCQQVYDAAGLPMFLRITPFSEPRDLSGMRGLVFSIRGDRPYRIWVQARDANPASAR